MTTLRIKAGGVGWRTNLYLDEELVCNVAAVELRFAADEPATVRILLFPAEAREVLDQVTRRTGWQPIFDADGPGRVVLHCYLDEEQDGDIAISGNLSLLEDPRGCLAVAAVDLR